MKTFEKINNLSTGVKLDLGNGVLGTVIARRTKNGVIVTFTTPHSTVSRYVCDKDIQIAFANLNSIGLQQIRYNEYSIKCNYNA